jgi:hypothetical protein
VVTNLSIHNTLQGESFAGCWRFNAMDIRVTILDSLGIEAMSEAVDRVHRIRLVGPWEWAAVPVLDVASWRKLRLPEDWASLPDVPGKAAFRRRFHSPTGLGPSDRVFVMIDTHGDLNEVRLNRRQLKCIPSVQLGSISRAFEITSALEEHNLLEITLPRIEPGKPELGLGRPVVLEIVSKA